MPYSLYSVIMSAKLTVIGLPWLSPRSQIDQSERHIHTVC